VNGGDGVNNTGIKKEIIRKRYKIIFKNRFRSQTHFSLLIKVLELLLRCPISVLAFSQKL
jgi:hypothetical protein